jgi:hypothetical protein
VLVVEPRIREQFEFSRAGALHAAALDALPPVFVGTGARLASLVSWLSAWLHAAFAAAAMPLPPWRSARALLAMWKLDTAEGAAAAAAAEDDVAEVFAAAAAASGAGLLRCQLTRTQRNGATFPVHVSVCTPPHAARWRYRQGAA